jgi:hypothetical protein
MEAGAVVSTPEDKQAKKWNYSCRRKEDVEQACVFEAPRNLVVKIDFEKHRAGARF